jgi:hypothetical protein
LTSDLKTPAFGLAFFLAFDNGVWPVAGMGMVVFQVQLRRAAGLSRSSNCETNLIN